MQFQIKLFGQTHTADTLAGISEAFCRVREERALGASEMPTPAVKQGRATVGHLSYNGKIWAAPSSAWKAGDVPLYDPSAPVKAHLAPVTDAASAEAFLGALSDAGLLYHPEESAADCLSHHNLPVAELERIAANMRATFDHLADPCETALPLIQ